MSVLVQMRVKVPDVERFIATSKRFNPLMEEVGAKNQALYQAENDPSEVTSMSEWDSPRSDARGVGEVRGTNSTTRPEPSGSSGRTRIWHRKM